MSYHLTLVRMAIFKKNKNKNVDKDVEERKLSHFWWELRWEKTKPVWYLFYMESKYTTNKWIKQKRNRLTDIEKKLVVINEEREWGRDNTGVGLKEGYSGIIQNHVRKTWKA